MKNIYNYIIGTLSLVLSLFQANPAKAQNYSISPNDTLIVSAPYNELTIFDIYMVNNVNTKISLSWMSISNTLPAGWDYSLCDLGSCYAGIPASGTMDSVNVGGQGFLGLNVNPYAISGTGTVRIYVYESGNQANGDTLTWIVTSSPTSTDEVTMESLISIYPNPAAGKINIQLAGTEVKLAFAELYTITGRKLAIKSLAGYVEKSFDISAYPAGVYFIRLIDENGAFTDKRFIKN